METSHSGAWSVGQRSETGYVRNENQDRMGWIRARSADIFVVSDGMGGRAGGAIAAQMTVDMLNRQLSGIDSLDDVARQLESAFRAANDAVYMRGQSSNPATVHMGATAIALLAAGDRVMLAHVGDSRAYLLSRRGALQRLTKDHSLVQRMVDARLLTEVEAASHPEASVLARAMGQAPQVEVEVSGWLRVHPGEVCMLCSDGLCGYVSDDEIAAVMRRCDAPQDTADALVRIALERGGEDNVTVQVMRYAGGVSLWRRPLARGGIATAAAALLALGWFGLHGKPFAPKDTNGSAPNAAASDSRAASATAVPAAGIATAPASPMPRSFETRLAALEAQAQKDAAERRADQAAIKQALDALSTRLSALEAKLAAARPANTPAPARSHAQNASRAPLAHKPAQTARAAGTAPGAKSGDRQTPGTSAPEMNAAASAPGEVGR